MAVVFSIIIPVYNIEDYVEKAVESILAQTCESWELILVDDGSSDGSGVICDKYARQNPKIRVIHKENGGLSDARNVGVSDAKGEYLLFLDGDDYIAEWTLEKLADVVQRDRCDVVLSEGFYYVFEDGRVDLKKYFKAGGIQNICGEKALEATSAIRSNWSACGKCFNRNFWIENHFIFVYKRLAEDFQLIDRVVIKAGRVTMIPPFYYYYQRDNSIMHRIDAKLLQDMLANFHDWENFFKCNKISNVLKRQLYACFATELCHVLMGYVSFLKDKRERKLITEGIKKYIFYLKHNPSMECRAITMSIRFIGVRKTCYLIGIIKKIRLKRGSQERCH